MAFRTVLEEYRDGQGLLHRNGAPAAIYEDGTEEWFYHGLRHRNDGPALICDESTEWWINGLLHREGGPAVIWEGGGEEWYCHGHLHRIDGPALSFVGGNVMWYVRGTVAKSLKQFQALSKLSDEDILILKLKYGDWADNVLR